MARFRFTLQAALDHRAAIEREKQRSVAALERERLALEEAIRQCHLALQREHAASRSALLGVLDLRAVRRQASVSKRHHASAGQAALRLAGVHQRLAAARAELLQAARRRKAVELLRDRRYEQWRLEQSRREAAAVDELVTMGHAAGRADAEAER